ncbi:MAG: dihydrodipicolinate synthase family protein [Dongiaceae bacterium]
MHDDLSRSVLAVPPLARRPDLRLDRAANAALIGYLERGGISTLMYGGNANLYHVGVSDYAELLDQLLELARPDTWVIPSIGPDFGKMLDQADLLRDRPYPTAMVLPSTAPSTVAGAEAGIARVAERLGRPLIVYLRGETFLDPPAIRRLVERGLVRAVKYGITRAEPRQDPFLRRLIDEVDRRIVVSGMGERPAIVHWQEFGLAGFTSGSVCVAPRASQAILRALKAGDVAGAERIRAAFLPLEDCRDTLHPVRVLHEAVRLAGIADTGAMLPLLSNLEPEHHERVRAAALTLRRYDESEALAA